MQRLFYLACAASFVILLNTAGLCAAVSVANNADLESEDADINVRKISFDGVPGDIGWGALASLDIKEQHREYDSEKTLRKRSKEDRISDEIIKRILENVDFEKESVVILTWTGDCRPKPFVQGEGKDAVIVFKDPHDGARHHALTPGGAAFVIPKDVSWITKGL